MIFNVFFFEFLNQLNSQNRYHLKTVILNSNKISFINIKKFHKFLLKFLNFFKFFTYFHFRQKIFFIIFLINVPWNQKESLKTIYSLPFNNQNHHNELNKRFNQPTTIFMVPLNMQMSWRREKISFCAKIISQTFDLFPLERGKF